MSKQKNLVTAQGRTDPNQNTGTSIQSCRVVPGPDLVPPAREAVPTYLGRPWKNFSRTVYMESYIDGHVDPKGWLEWDGAVCADTLYYGEFANVGPGAGLAGRVNWTGYNVITDPDVASRFTVAQLIQGGTWLQSTGVEYTEGLYL
ncbi:putative pectinesterase [Iris pallida]|uniref:Pectinesterase n=1 Tax=Iris pallida TaxID=29817 RepID=A0AAX6FTQ4_IRIPA|nr:putative pectinesterase [Iris pallida]